MKDLIGPLKEKRHDIGAASMWLSIMFLVMSIMFLVMSIALRYTGTGFVFVWFSIILLIFSGYELDIFKELDKNRKVNNQHAWPEYALEDRFVLDALESAFRYLTREYKIARQQEAAPRTVQTDLFAFFPQEAGA